MSKDKRLMVIVFGILSFLNINGYLIINERAVFGLTLGALIISISTCFDFSEDLNRKNVDENKKKWWTSNKIFKIIQEALYSIGFVIMFVVIFIKPDTIVDKFMDTIDSNTLMLMAICTTFLSIEISYISGETKKNNLRKYYLDIYEEKVNEINEKIKKIKGSDNAHE